MAETLTIRTSASTDVIKVVERGPQGPIGPQGPAGAAGASAWNDITGKPATFPPSAHDHQPGEVYADAAFVSQTGGSGRGGIYLRNGSDNGKPLYESPATGDYIWWDSNIDTWYLTSRPGVNLFEITNNTDDFPWETDALWQPIAPQTGNVEVDQASLFDVSDYSSTSVVGLKTPKSGNASSDELVLGSDTRLTNSRTPTAHASTHYTGGSDPLTPADIGAATTASTVAAAKALADEFTGNAALIYTSEGGNGWTTLTEPASFRTALELGTAATADSTDFAPAVTEIEVPNNGTSTTTLTTGQLPARVIIFVDADAAPSATINLPTPGVRQSGLLASIKVQIESGSAAGAFITVVHDATTLLNGYELDEAESSIDFLWDGYAWTYSSTSRLRSYPDRVLQLPNASGTIARTEDFASPPAIGTTPNSGAFTTLNVNGSGSADLVAEFGTAAAGRNHRIDIWGNGAGRNHLITANGPSGLQFSVAAGAGHSFLSTTGIRTASGLHLGWSSTAQAAQSPDTTLFRDAADTVAQRRDANPQTFRLYNTFTDASNHERGFMRWSSNNFEIGSEAAGTGSNREVRIVAGTSTYRFATNSSAIFPGTVNIAATAEYQWFNRSIMSSSASGIILITNSARNDWSRLQFGGTTSSFPALKRNSTTLEARLADDSAYTAIQGKLTTETAYTAGAPTATGYLVLYDSNGTAYKVPAEAL